MFEDSLNNDCIVEIGQYLDIMDYSTLHRMSPIFNTQYIQRMNIFNDFISELGFDKNVIATFLEQTNGVLSGSSLLRAISGDEWDVYDIDIFIPNMSDDDMKACCSVFDRQQLLSLDTMIRCHNYDHIKEPIIYLASIVL